MSPAGQELGAAIFAAAFFALFTVVFVREESKAWAWGGAMLFFAFSLLAAWLLWRML